MNRRWIVLLVWLLGQGLFAGPAHDARFLNVDISYRLNRDGSWIMDYAHQVRLETGYAFNRALGESFIVYNPSFQSLRILKAETIMAGGKKVASPTNAYNEVLPSPAHGFADYSQLREMVVTHTGLERGAVIDLHYQVLTRPGFLPYFSGREILAKAFPVDRFRLRIVFPQERKTSAQVLNLDTQPVVSATGGEKTLSLELKNLPPIPAEAGFSENDLPVLYFSTASGWDEALPGLSSAELPTPLRDWMERIRTENPGTLKKLLAVQKMIAVDIDTCPVDPSQSGLQARDCGKVYLSNYGTPMEKSLLLHALLKNLGMAPELLAVLGGQNVAEAVPTVFQISGYLVKVNMGSHAVYLDPVALQSEFYPYKREGFPAYNIDRRAFESLPARGSDDNRIDISGKLSMTGNQIKGMLSVSWKGYANQFRSTADNPKEWIAGALRKILPLSDISIRKTLLLEPGETSVELDVTGNWLQPLAPGIWEIRSFPYPPQVVPEWIQMGERDFPLYLDVPFSYALRLNVALENSFVPAGIAADLRLENAVGSFSRVIRFTSDSHLEIAIALDVGKRLISTREYPQFRELLKNCFRSDSLLLLKKKTPD